MTWVVVATVLAGLYFLLDLARSDKRLRHGDSSRALGWQRLASQYGFTDIETQAGPSVSARKGRLRLRFTSATTMLVDDPERPIPLTTHPRSEDPPPGLVPTGNAVFDGAFRVTGPPSLVHALLTARVREDLVVLSSEARVEIEGGVLRAIGLERGGTFTATGWMLGRLQDLAMRLTDLVDVPVRLAGNAAQDPESAVRVQNLLALGTGYGDHPVTAPTLATALADASPDVRLHAACLQSLVRGDAASVLAQLEEILSVETSPLAASAATLLARLDQAHAEGPLLRALQRERPDLAVAAARALGDVGTAVAIPALHAVEQSGDPALRQAAARAIAQIRLRLPEAPEGHVSLAAPEAGEVSLAGDEQGRLSLTPQTLRSKSAGSD